MALIGGDVNGGLKFEIEEASFIYISGFYGLHFWIGVQNRVDTDSQWSGISTEGI
jgi:hypothetical protein